MKGDTGKAVNACDYSRSFLKFTTDHSHHTPRMQLIASCNLTGPDGSSVEFYLTGMCVSENMYRTSGLIQDPPYIFYMIAGDNQFLMLKQHASVERDVREAHRVGDRMSTNDGKGSTVLKIDIGVREHSRMKKVDSYGEIRDAILGNKILNARTTYTSGDGRVRCRLDYPVVVCNVPHDQEGWQIDTGPMLVPDPDFSGPPDPDFSSPLPITCLNLGYIVFNSVDWAEIALRRPTGVGTGGGATQHFSKIVRLDGVTNEIFCAC